LALGRTEFPRSLGSCNARNPNFTGFLDKESVPTLGEPKVTVCATGASKRKQMNPQIKAYKEKTQAELQKIKTQLTKFEADEKAKDQQVAVDLMNQLKRTHQNIEKQVHALETAADADIQQEKTVIDAGITKLRTDLAQLGNKLNTPRTKAG